MIETSAYMMSESTLNWKHSLLRWRYLYSFSNSGIFIVASSENIAIFRLFSVRFLSKKFLESTRTVTTYTQFSSPLFPLVFRHATVAANTEYFFLSVYWWSTLPRFTTKARLSYRHHRRESIALTDKRDWSPWAKCALSTKFCNRTRTERIARGI